MNTRLDDLSDRFRPLAFELLARLTEQGIQVKIINTLRSLDEQKRALAQGTSWTMNSRHLPDAQGKANAIDLAPVEVLDQKNWNPGHPSWQRMGAIGEALGLRWGGKFKQHKDMCHFELPEEAGKA